MTEPDRNTSKAALVGRTCSKTKWNWTRARVCGKPAKVIEGGKAFCGVHDPERQRKHRAAEEEKRTERAKIREEQDRKRDEDRRKLACHAQLVEALEAARAFVLPEVDPDGPLLSKIDAAIAAAKVRP